MKKLATVETFTTASAVRLTGLTSTMLDYLCREKFISPSASTERRRGKPRLFTFGDLITLRVIGRLLRSGIEVRRLAKGLRELRERLGSSGINNLKYVVSDGVDVFLSESGALESLTSNGQLSFAFLVDLTICEKEILIAMEEAFDQPAAV